MTSTSSSTTKDSVWRIRAMWAVVLLLVIVAAIQLSGIGGPLGFLNTPPHSINEDWRDTTGYRDKVPNDEVRRSVVIGQLRPTAFPPGERIEGAYLADDTGETNQVTATGDAGKRGFRLLTTNMEINATPVEGTQVGYDEMMSRDYWIPYWKTSRLVKVRGTIGLASPYNFNFTSDGNIERLAGTGARLMWREDGMEYLLLTHSENLTLDDIIASVESAR